MTATHRAASALLPLFTATLVGSCTGSDRGINGDEAVGTDSAELSTDTALQLAHESVFGIPLVDLAHESDRQVVVDRDPDQYLGHPTTQLLEDGRLLVVYPEGHGQGPIVYKRSDDGGLTWTDRLPVPESWATSQEVPTLYQVTTPEGAGRLILFSGLYPIRDDLYMMMANHEYGVRATDAGHMTQATIALPKGTSNGRSMRARSLGSMSIWRSRFAIWPES